MPGLIPKTAFIGIDHIAHLATGGEAPVLRANLAAATQFLLDKGDGMPGRERFFVDGGPDAEAALAAGLGGRPEDVAFLGSASEGLHVASEGIDWRPGDNVVVGQSEFPSVLLALAAAPAARRRGPRRWAARLWWRRRRSRPRWTRARGPSPSATSATSPGPATTSGDSGPWRTGRGRG